MVLRSQGLDGYRSTSYWLVDFYEVLETFRPPKKEDIDYRYHCALCRRTKRMAVAELYW